MTILTNVKNKMRLSRLIPRRAALAQHWRKLVLVSVCALGLLLFGGMEFLLGYLLSKSYFMAAIGILALLGTLFVCIAYPFWGYAMWFFLTCYLSLFARAFPARYSFDLNMLSFLAMVLVFRTLATKTKLSRPSLPEVLLIVFYIYGYILRRPFDLEAPVNEMKLLAMSPLMFYYIAKGAIKNRNQAHSMMVLIVITGVSFALMGFYEQITGKMWLASLLGGNRGLYADMRSTGPAGNYYVYGNSLILTFMLCLHLLHWQKRWFPKFTLVLSGLTALLGLYYGFSRGPYVGFVVCVLLMALVARRTRRAYIVTVSALTLVVFLAVPILMGHRDIRSRMESDTTSVRRIFNKTSMNMFRANPLFGIGRGTYVQTVPRYIASGHLSIKRFGGISTVYSRPHSEYFLMLAELGLVGFVTYFGMYLAFLGMFLRLRTRLPQEEILGGELASLAMVFAVGVLVTMLTEEFGAAPYMYAVLFTLFALVKRSAELDRAERTESVPGSVPTPAVRRSGPYEGAAA